ncbi:GNAT family N-acetyltransferase [Nocardioides ferulae]|uniref:GNAT family N-acetyltransferase n=1 Tax=Nocardioides ferulae TaxID=2340821 RepID=UPI00198070F6|nr:N-acetyltransferase [Nocardioides ferulae]
MSQHPLSVLVRPAQPADRTAVQRVILEAFGAEGVTADEAPRIVELVGALDATGHTQVSLVAEVDGAVVGHTQLSRSWVDAREALVEVMVLAPLSVVPDRQRQGVGAALVAAALEAARSLASPAVFLEGDPAYYGRLGFVRASELGFARPSPRIPDPAFQVVVLPGHEPWMSGPLVYCDPFWALDCVGLRDPLLAELEQRFADG